jgi:hypothetical protein
MVWAVVNLTTKSAIGGAACVRVCDASCDFDLCMQVGKTLTSLRCLPRKWAV